MGAVKRKAVAETSVVSKKRQQQQKVSAQPAFVDPYIDPSDNEEGSESEQDVADETAEVPEFLGDNDSADEDEAGSDDDEAAEEDSAEADATPKRKKLAATHDLYKAPTNDEMQQLRDTTDLFKSNLFKLQIDELMNNVRIDHTKTGALEKALRKVKEVLDTVDDIPELGLAEITQNMKAQGIVIPFPNPAPPADAQYKFPFKRPSKVFVVGSYLLKTVAKSPSGTNVDIVVQMPDSVFQDKDTVNYRYFYKRAYYVAVLAAELRKHRKELGIKLEFEAFQGDLRRPVLVLKSAGVGSQYDFAKLGFSIKILVTFSQALFPATRLAPGRNNVRPSYLAGSATPSSTADHTPTPRYNAALLQDTAFVTHMNLLHHHVTTCGGFRDACILAKVWLTQRGFSGATGGFSGFLFSMVMGYLLRTNDKNGNRRLGNSFSSYQLLKVTMEFLANHDFQVEPVFMTPDGKPLADKEFSAEDFVAAYEVVIVDPSGKINLASSLSKSSMDELQFEAKRSTELFNDVANDHFEALFLRKVNVLHLRYDNVARIAAVAQPPAAYTPAVALDYPTVHDFLLTFIPKLLKKALKNRAALVCARSEPLSSWRCSTAPTTHEDLETAIHIGLMLKGEDSLAVIELGPSADDEEGTQAFRELWGEKAELRRFKNGDIMESVLFDCDGTLEQRSLVLGRMVAYLLELHVGIRPKEGLSYWAGQLHKFLRAPGIEMQVSSFQPVMDAFNKFAKNLRHLEGLPLSVTQTIPCAEGLRYTSVFVPQPRLQEDEAAVEAYRPYYEPLDCIIEFETTPRWPGDLKAIQLSKRAFYLEIAELFMAQHPGTRATVSTGLGTHILDSGHVEVTVDSGFTFRCTIHVDREALLLEKALKDDDATKAHENHALARMHYQRSYIRSTYHSTRLQNLCLRFPFLPQTIRLTKRWLAAHLLSPQVPIELIEIICAKVFVEATSWGAPSSGMVGFLRTLELLRTWDWKKEPMIVELEPGMMNGEIRNKIATAFRTSRGLQPDGTLIPDSPRKPLNPAMWVATEQDVNGEWWGLGKPGMVIVERIKGLAAAALAHVDGLVRNGGSEKSISKLFVSLPKGYSLLLRLDPSKLPRFRESLSYDPDATGPKPKYKNLVSMKDRELALLSEIDPVEYYLRDLHTAFGDCALFFHDRYGGDVIGVVWNPTVVVEGNWKVDTKFNVEAVLEKPQETQASAGKKSAEKLRTKPNLMAMVSEMHRLGEGLVVAVDVC
ncbi:hypothetical protein PhCBS80983_g00180 [Powellomyces hirtus]|uniref:U3 small nucleolar RNA-associated protein 22 n=1 Tax=Powellomyces hirtus TaxID=109895 RepID=A0A507EI11_9FUNG|nr:hypothetical protein PhCBS80983_g00180 [Powellomyces hirtus]